MSRTTRSYKQTVRITWNVVDHERIVDTVRVPAHTGISYTDRPEFREDLANSFLDVVNSFFGKVFCFIGGVLCLWHRELPNRKRIRPLQYFHKQSEKGNAVAPPCFGVLLIVGPFAPTVCMYYVL